jgi:hypothetical protein
LENGLLSEQTNEEILNNESSELLSGYDPLLDKKDAVQSDDLEQDNSEALILETGNEAETEDETDLTFNEKKKKKKSKKLFF